MTEMTDSQNQTTEPTARLSVRYPVPALPRAELSMLLANPGSPADRAVRRPPHPQHRRRHRGHRARRAAL